MMLVIERYKTIREFGLRLNHKIINSHLDRNILFESVKVLGIIQGDTFVFDSEEETSVLMDFSLHEYKSNNRNTIEIYRERIGGQNEIEREILDSLILSYTSLFKVIAMSGNTLILKDVLTKEDKNIKVIDISFSETATPGLLIFTRLIPFNDLTMTSGISFVFRSELEKYTIKRYKKIRKKIKSENDSMKRFLSFFKLNKEYGEEVSYRVI